VNLRNKLYHFIFIYLSFTEIIKGLNKKNNILTFDRFYSLINTMTTNYINNDIILLRKHLKRLNVEKKK